VTDRRREGAANRDMSFMSLLVKSAIQKINVNVNIASMRFRLMFTNK
jgi:hypothetical protein